MSETIGDTKIPDPAGFSVNAREGEYVVRLTITGDIRMTIKATDIEDARVKAAALRYSEDLLEIADCDLDTVSVDAVYKERERFRVTRDGLKMQVTNLAPGDLPREPDERGF